MKYAEICERLERAGIANARWEARLLMEELLSDFSETEDYQSEKLSSAVERRCERYPLQYIIGKWWLARCEFEVSEDCLVPRPDTETVVELAAKLLPNGALFADLCTGSGCIAISVLDLRADTSACAVELYPRTLDIAKRNALKNNVSDRFEGLLGDVLEKNTLEGRKFSAIISNPPYIRSNVIPTLEKEVQSEPHAALDGGEDGLIFYRAIVDNFSENLETDGFFLFEIGYDQGEDLAKIAQERGFSCEIYKDLGGCERAVILKKLQR